MQRKFILGEEWLYYKIYCGIRIADSILVELILPLTNQLLIDRIITEWFFIRYSDPDPHIRLRIRITNCKNLCTVIETVRQEIHPFIQERLVWYLQTDTYVRELERYGEKTMEISEQIFFYDSKLIANALSLIEDEELYFLFIMKCVDSFLNQFQFLEKDKLRFLETNAGLFKKEFDVERLTKMSLSEKFKILDAKYNGDFAKKIDSKHESLEKSLAIRNKEITSLVRSIYQLKDDNELEKPVQNLLTSYIHMFINRAFRNRQRFYEMVGYDYLMLQNRKSRSRHYNL